MPSRAPPLRLGQTPSSRTAAALPATASFLLSYGVYFPTFYFLSDLREFHSYGSPAHPYGALSLDFLASLGTSAPDLKTTRGGTRLARARQQVYAL